ncbi:hypothetical protein TNCV_1460671 [Trichonephila clavipes]|nr:hypothetical protein TNCV_1460671 [Trichonephila clavipes]
MMNYIVPWGRRCSSRILYVVFIKVYVRAGGHPMPCREAKMAEKPKIWDPGQLEIMTVLSQVLYIFAPSRLIFNLQCNGVATNGLGWCHAPVCSDSGTPSDPNHQGSRTCSNFSEI